MDGLAQQLAGMHKALLRSAHARLRNPDWAADAVSATAVAALEARPPSDDPARLRAWLFGVLRHKVVDQLRRELGHGPGAGASEGPGNALVTAVGDGRDLDWRQPADGLEGADPLRRACEAEFIAALAQALTRLPERQAQAFLMCEAWGMGSGEACAALGVTSGHLWVLLHRARQRLRLALAAHADG